jgi:hypothetical protein
MVFARVNGAPLRPDQVLDRSHGLTAAAGLPRVRLHDLRHLAATIKITSGVPLALESKTLRHTTSGITADLYGHLTRQAASPPPTPSPPPSTPPPPNSRTTGRHAIRPQDPDPRLPTSTSRSRSDRAHTVCCAAELTSMRFFKASYLRRARAYASGPARPADAQPAY